MPEAIVVEKVLRHDERTSCMRPDLRITLNVDAIDYQSKLKSPSSNLQLRKVFRNRLLDFFKSHPEVLLLELSVALLFFKIFVLELSVAFL